MLSFLYRREVMLSEKFLPLMSCQSSAFMKGPEPVSARATAFFEGRGGVYREQSFGGGSACCKTHISP
ncbi:hypothetical protein CKW39_14880 [Kocuria sp. WRN011]|nr:hypothetical protein CKW39_14880 [Kocuria sp. WRN011]